MEIIIHKFKVCNRHFQYTELGNNLILEHTRKETSYPLAVAQFSLHSFSSHLAPFCLQACLPWVFLTGGIIQSVCVRLTAPSGVLFVYMYLTIQKQHLQMLVVAKFVVKMSDLILVKKVTTGRRQRISVLAASSWFHWIVVILGLVLTIFSSFLRSWNLCDSSFNTKLEKA